ncbi:MAG: bifunctional hydroxymethylpyrimidine kinase/phosphomethylpyrimidine kinase [Rhodospirillales bacterium 12-54-5]|nr:MAG: bifunctional hydroxymethylpyrimidine kinase/phosphomethylpyrimidine kinase [Rhodospirillales bacterium 12-54-5]
MRSARVLIIAGSDSGGGAGIQGDLKTVQALGGYGMTAITALTAQNTLGVSDIYPVPPTFIVEQMRMCLDDIGADAIKTGMLHSAEVIEAIVNALPANVPLVVDPVMMAKGGAPLLAEAALHALKSLLIPMATIITPNLPEAELLLGRTIDPSPESMEIAAQQLLALGCSAVLLKGGHALLENGSAPTTLTDILVMRDVVPIALTAPRINTRHTHGTGCAFASAIATGIAQKLSLQDAVRRAHGYVQEAIARAPGLGSGHGPLGH